jgi:hypothetical protein
VLLPTFLAYRELIRSKLEGDGGKKGDKANDGEEEQEEEEDVVEDPLLWIPKKLVTEWKNKDGIKCVTLIIQLTGGSADSDNDGVQCKVSNSGDEFVISEVWSELMSQIDEFYHYFPKATDETEDEFNRRKYAMEDKVQSISDNQTMKSIHRMKLPFRVDPTVMRIRFLGTSDGCRFAHIDLAERKKVTIEKVIMINTNNKKPLNSSLKRKYDNLA